MLALILPAASQVLVETYQVQQPDGRRESPVEFCADFARSWSRPTPPQQGRDAPGLQERRFCQWSQLHEGL
jgi:hypothetical protein